MTIVQMFKIIKAISENSGLVSTVKLVKSIDNVESAIEQSKLRAVLVAPKGVTGENANEFVYKILIIDKVPEEEDDIFLASINDGISLAKDFVESSTKLYDNRAEIREMNINSGMQSGELFVTIDFDLAFEFDAVPV